jgi:hypothetical protein
MQKHMFASALIVASVAAMVSCARSEPQPQQQMFASPEEAVKGLAQVVQAADLQQLTEIFGPDSKELVDTSDPVTARRNRETFTVAFAEGWKLVDAERGGKTLVIGNEDWPFPVPIVQDGNRWRFDTAAGKAEVLARRIGRNELAVIRICGTYVAAQHRYAEHGHDGKPARLYAQSFRSDPGKENGLFWPEVKGPAAQPARRPRRAGGQRRAADRRRQGAAAVPGLLLQDPHGAGSGGTRRREVVHQQRRDVGRFRPGRLARAVRFHRRHDLHRQPGRHRPRKGPGERRRRHREPDDRIQSRRLLEARGIGTPRRHEKRQPRKRENTKKKLIPFLFS